MIEVRCCQHLCEAAPFRDAINALNIASARPDPFSTFEYYERFIRNPEWFPVRDDMDLWFLLAFEDDRLVGYLALKRRIDRVLGFSSAKLEFLTGKIASRPHVVTWPTRERAVGAAFYGYILGRKKEWSLLEFHQQDDESVLLKPPPEAGFGSLRLCHWPTWANGTIVIRWDSIGGYFSALSKKFRSNLSRQIRILMASGDVQLLSSSDPQSLPALFKLYLSVDEHSWKDHVAAENSGNPAWSMYYSGLVEPGQLMKPMIIILLLEGVPIGGLICGAFEKGLYALNIAYDDRFSRVAPGSIVLFMGIRAAIDNGYKFFDLLSGFDYYKANWLAHMSETRSVQIYRRGSLYALKRILGDAKRRCLGPDLYSYTTLSNTSKKIIKRPEQVSSKDGMAGWSAPKECKHHRAEIIRSQLGKGEFLSHEQIAAAMPFETTRRNQ